MTTQRRSRTAAPADKADDAIPPEILARLRGSLPAILALSRFRKNEWNPTGITPRKRAEIKRGFETDGWLVTQALLVWGLDDKGIRRDIIIDGEQRFTVALSMTPPITHGPVSFIDGLTEAQARALTIKMNSRRAGGGEFDDARLGDVLRFIAPTMAGVADAAFDLGLDPAAYRRLTEPPNFQPEGQENQGKLHVKVEITCPHCLKKFVRK